MSGPKRKTHRYRPALQRRRLARRAKQVDLPFGALNGWLLSNEARVLREQYDVAVRQIGEAWARIMVGFEQAWSRAEFLLAAALDGR
jgi:hypothetical protein